MNANPAPQSSVRRRPSVWWFAVPVALLVAAAASFGLLLWSTLESGLRTDAEVPLDGQTHEVSVPADTERTVFVGQGSPDPTCTFLDAATDAEVGLSPVRGSFTRSNQHGEWRARWVLAPSSGRLVASCTGEGTTPVQLAPPLAVGRFVGGVLATVLVPLALGGLALVSLIVLGVLFVTRRPGTDVHPATRQPPGPR